MSVQNPKFNVTRWSVVGIEAMWAKMFDPPTESPPPTDQLLLVPQQGPQGLIRPNPVPEVMAAALLQRRPTTPGLVQRDLMHGLKMETWDNRKKPLEFFVIADRDNFSASAGTYPGPTLRMPRGVIFNADVTGQGPPPHTIHWHGMEPTPMNDGVGHCSMELGHYTYQWQPNFMGFYFLHCHRNTMQHFEFGLYSALIFETPDCWFASIASTRADGSVVLNSVPLGYGRDGKRRVACNLDNPLTGLPRFTQFPGFNRRPVDSPDDRVLGPSETNVRFPTDPHAMTVPFDVEALMVFDDRDSTWSDLGSNPRTTFPSFGTIPGINDQFTLNPGANGFASFNDFNADYWFVTGVPVPASKGGVGTIPAGSFIPAGLNSGIGAALVNGVLEVDQANLRLNTQISVNAVFGETILLRILNAAYNYLRVTLPVDVIVIAWDGRALGVAPYGHNESYLVPAGTPIEMSVGRRFDALAKVTSAADLQGDYIIAQFINNKSQVPEAGEQEEIMVTARVPFQVNGDAVPPVTFSLRGTVKDQLGTPMEGYRVTASPKSLSATPSQTVLTDAQGKYTIDGATNGSYGITAAKPDAIKLFLPASQVILCNNQDTTVPDIVVSIADFAPNSYTLPDALKSLRDVVGIDQPSSFEKLRFDVAPLINGIPAPDNVLDLRDSLNVLRMVVGLNPL
jgi:hypothetical protein